MQNVLYTSAVNSSFRWNCGSDPVLKVNIDSALSETAVGYSFNASPFAAIEDFINPGTAKSWMIISKRNDIQSVRVSFSFTPVSSSEEMHVWLSAWEGNE